MKKNCFMMMAMMMRMCGMRTFSNATFSDSSIITRLKTSRHPWARPSFVFNRETSSESHPVFVLPISLAKGTSPMNLYYEDLVRANHLLGRM